MSADNKPGLKIRRKREEAEAAEEATPTATDAATQTAESAPAPAAPAPSKPAAPRLVQRAAATADDSKRSTAWRSEALPAAGAQPEPEPEPEKPKLAPADMPTTDDFAAMLGDGPVAVRRVEVGEKVTAKVVAIGADAVFVAVGGKAEGAIDRSELLGDDEELAVAVGDEIEAYVVSVHDGIRLSKALSKGADNQEMLEEAHAQQIPIEGKVTGSNKGGFEVDALGSRAFCPFSQIDLDPTSQPEDHIGATYHFLITRVEEGGRNVVVSRRKLLENERAAIAEETIEAIAPGAVFEGNVTRVADFGAFVDIGGIDGLVHVSELAWSRLDHPSEMVRVGDRVKVKVLSASDLHDPKHRRIALSVKALEEDPWTASMADLQVGQSLTGQVARLEHFGAFIELRPGVDGLVHISEIHPGRRINHPKEVLSPGDTVEVQVVSIDPMKRRIGLSMKALMDDPWSVAAKEMPVGSTIQGEVESVQSFGVFVALPGGISGLLPMSQLPDDEAKNVYNRYRAGTPVEARVLAVEPTRQRLTLTRREDSESEGKAAFANYKATKADTGGGLGTFADLLKKR